MTEQVSIWRWAITQDLEPLFSRLVAASDAEFGVICAEVEGEAEPARSVDDIEAATEAKMRTMGLPDDILETMLRGLKGMMEEARQADDEEEDDTAPDGRMAISLASSHMFFDDPFASLEYPEIERQVAEKVSAYVGAISNALGDHEQSMAAYLGISGGGDVLDDVFDVLLENELAAVEWVWPARDHVYYLSRWHEDKELPIDLEFGRAPLAVFEKVRVRLRASHEM